MKYAISQKGKPLLIYQGFSYRKRREMSDGKMLWVCSKIKECRGKLYTIGNVCVAKGYHHHLPA